MEAPVMYEAFAGRDKGDHVSDLLRCCQALDGYRRDEAQLCFQRLLVKRVSMPVSVVPGATTLTLTPVLQLPVRRILSALPLHVCWLRKLMLPAAPTLP